MSKKSWVSAADLMAELQQDPEYQKQQAERERTHEERVQRIRAAAEPVVHGLQSAGFAVDAVEELAIRYAPIPKPAIDILLSWLPRVQDDTVREMIVRALAATTEPFDGQSLARAFEESGSESLRWAIGNTMALAHPTGLAEWVLEAVADPASGKARETLAIATATLVPAAIACRTLPPLLEEFPVSVAQAFAQCGGPTEAALLQAWRGRTKGWQRKEIDKAIRAIQKRHGSAT
ncbi:MAG TPA: hypothetical protein VGC13_04270 [Longimicrobium sp.]|jgi:hypothetical protein|uniref:hypothetical protein n=1 Tax=Longimicrobium sp. TaxID=2029185 RepID=UPI002ED8C493